MTSTAPLTTDTDGPDEAVARPATKHLLTHWRPEDPEFWAATGKRIADIQWPEDTVLVGIIRDDRPIAPSRDDAVEAHDELLFITTPDNEDVLEQMLSPGFRPPREDD